jgi:hypothetical protein
MPVPGEKSGLATAPNGVVAPLYFDRQVVRAEDLTLDRASHDAELARMRRILHGWGVVAGLIPALDDDTLTVSPGYGITPLGDEVYLTTPLSVDQIRGRVWGCCGPGQAGCEVVDEEDIRAIAAAAEVGEVTSWLIARPLSVEGDLRPGVPEGCAHPANNLLPSRACDAVALELICELPASHHSEPADIAGMCQLVCNEGAGRSTGDFALRPMPEPVAQSENFVVLGRLIATTVSVRFHPADRRPLLPVWLLQAWVMACTCPSIYYVNRNPQHTDAREHEVHRVGCPGLVPAEENRLYLGMFSNCADAIREARKHFEAVDGCANCVPECHTR